MILVASSISNASWKRNTIIFTCTKRLLLFILLAEPSSSRRDSLVRNIIRCIGLFRTNIQSGYEYGTTMFGFSTPMVGHSLLWRFDVLALLKNISAGRFIQSILKDINVKIVDFQRIIEPQGIRVTSRACRRH
jgi:hypothetical protein